MLHLRNFEEELQLIDTNYKNTTYLLAVSGGVDSMVMLHLFDELKLNFQVAHINYQLRGTDSDMDENLVKEYCIDKNIKYHIYGVCEEDKKPENSIQEWARDIRYRFFDNIKHQEHLDKLVTAHHLNDNIETFLINLSRGSGIIGLSGIPQNKNGIIRPLLSFTKEDCYAFAKAQEIPFREDLSNQKNDYVRNQFRNLVIPQIEEIQPKFIENSQKSIDYINDAQEFIKEQIKSIEKEITISKTDDTITIQKSKLENKTVFIQYEILKKFGLKAPNEIEKVFSAETGKSFFSPTHQILINRDELLIRKSGINKKNEEIILVESIENVSLSNPSILLARYINIDETFSWEFDLEKINFPIKLRKRKEGDIFYPKGMNGKMKVSKFYKDKKLSIFAKEDCWILCDDEQILGLPPFRQDRRKGKNKKTNKKLYITN